MSVLDLACCLGVPEGQDFDRRLVQALKALPPGSLPLYGACTQGGMVDEDTLSLSVLTVDRADCEIRARIGAFFIERVGGCNCNDDPTCHNVYGILELALDRSSGMASVTLADGR